MQSKMRLSLALSLILAATISAQTATHYWYPTGTDTQLGGSNNTIPIWASAGTYQQVHDFRDIQRQGKVQIWKGLAFRPASNYVVPGRKMDVAITLGQSSVSPFAASATFASNLGSNPTIVIGGKDTQGALTFSSISWSSNTQVVGLSPPNVLMPFTKTYIFAGANGHLCWEWRMKNSSIVANGPMDATTYSIPNNYGTASFSGTACTTNNVTSSARFNINTVATNWRREIAADLTSAPANAKALMAVGAVTQTANVGWCTTIQVQPFWIIFGQTDSSGIWSTKVQMSQLMGLPQFTLHAQFAYDDSTKAAGLALSNLASYQLPIMTGAYGITRIYKTTYQSTTNGDELATSGTVGYTYGLVTGFQK